MPRCYWLPLFAIVGLLAGHVQADPVSPSASRKAPQDSQSKPRPDTPPAIPVAVQNDIRNIAGALKTANERKPSSTDERNAKAQERVADWAPWMFGVAVLETFVTLTGVFLVWRTLKATWAATSQARRAADAAERALEETRRAANATVGAERDRVRPHHIFLNDNRAPSWTPTQLLEMNHITLRFRNGGKSPANITAISVNWCVVESLPDEPVYSATRAIGPGEQHIGAGEAWEVTSWGWDHDEQIERDLATEILYGDDQNYWVYGYIEYDNFVGDKEVRKFCARLDGNRLAVYNDANLVLGGPRLYTE